MILSRLRILNGKNFRCSIFRRKLHDGNFPRRMKNLPPEEYFERNKTKIFLTVGGVCVSGLSVLACYEYLVPHIPWHGALPDWFDEIDWMESDDFEPFEEVFDRDELEFSFLFGERFCKSFLIIPFNGLSRLWGKINLKIIPESLRNPILGLYSWMYACNLDEAVDPNLKHYQNLSEFFRRAIKPECRPIAQNSELVSPADGKMVVCGPVRQGKIEQIKGCTYPVTDFLGPGLSPPTLNKAYFYCVIYLAPGDYHGFHSPANWSALVRRHFTGRLLSVGQWATFRIRQLHCLNERVVLWGKWKHGFFSMAAVGATNVGNIKIVQDPDLQTNLRKSVNIVDDKILGDWKLSSGEKVGEFQLGSSIVLVFEAPNNFKFTKLPDDVLKFGQSLGKVPR